MQELHLVGITTDRQHLIFSIRRGAKSGSYLVAVGEELREVVDELADERAERRAAAAAAPPRPDAQLTVREMQARLRAGASVGDVAADAGVDEDWVERFAAPVRAEQLRIVALARTLPMVRARAGASAEPLGVAVTRAMAERGITFAEGEFDAAWGARMTARDQWEVDFSYTHRSNDRTVTWVLDLDEQCLTTSDRSASQIGFVAPDAEPSPSRRRARPAPSRRASQARPSGARRDDRSGDTERSTRGDGRPDTAPSTQDVQRARRAADSGVRRRAAERAEAARSRPAAPEPEPVASVPEPPSATEPEPEPDAPAVTSGADTEAVPPPFVPAVDGDAAGVADASAADDTADTAGAAAGDSDATDDAGDGENTAEADGTAEDAAEDTADADGTTAEDDSADDDSAEDTADDEDDGDEAVDEAAVQDGADPTAGEDDSDGTESTASDAETADASAPEPDDEADQDDEPRIAFEFGDEVVEDAPASEVADVQHSEDLAADAEHVDDEPPLDDATEKDSGPVGSEPRLATARFRSGAAVRAGDVERRQARPPAPEPTPRPPASEAFEIPDPWARTPEPDTGPDDARSRIRVRARSVRADDASESAGADDEASPPAAPPSSNGRPPRRRRTRPLRAR